jgi:hypothetical protein
VAADTPQLPHAKKPCAECPWRLDAQPGQFPACRYDALRATAGRPGAEAPLGAPIFACHKTVEGREIACAGWLAVVGRDHLGVRLAVATGRLDPAAVAPADDWPQLYPTYEDMARANGASP